MSNLVLSWMHIDTCRYLQESVRMLLQSRRALCETPGGSGIITQYWEALVRGAGVSGRCVCSFQTDLHIADAARQSCSIPHAWCGAPFFTDGDFKDSSTHKLIPLHRGCLANYHLEIGFRQKHGDTSSITRGILSPIQIFCDIFQVKAICT